MPDGDRAKDTVTFDGYFSTRLRPTSPSLDAAAHHYHHIIRRTDDSLVLVGE